MLDFDVHHGNGTVDICRHHPEILVCSSFQSPHYPNRLDNLVQPNIVNTPLQAGSDGLVFRAAIERDWLPAIEAHQPDIIFISAGLMLTLMTLADIRLVEEDYRWVTNSLSPWQISTRGSCRFYTGGGIRLKRLAYPPQRILKRLPESTGTGPSRG